MLLKWNISHLILPALLHATVWERATFFSKLPNIIVYRNFCYIHCIIILLEREKRERSAFDDRFVTNIFINFFFLQNSLYPACWTPRSIWKARSRTSYCNDVWFSILWRQKLHNDYLRCYNVPYRTAYGNILSINTSIYLYVHRFSNTTCNIFISQKMRILILYCLYKICLHIVANYIIRNPIGGRV